MLCTLMMMICLGSLPPHVPQVLVNREPLRHLNFDVELLGDCDVIVNELCHRLGGHFSELCSTVSPAAEITTDDVALPPETSSSSGVSVIHIDSEPVVTGTKTVTDDAADISLPPALSGSRSKASSNLAQATTEYASNNADDVSLPVATVSATVSDSSSSASQTITENAGDDVVKSPAPSTELHVDAGGSLGAGSETVANDADVDSRHSKNAVYRAEESPKMQTVSWASLLKRMHC